VKCSRRAFPLLTHLRHKLDPNLAARQAVAVPRCAILSVGSTGETRQ
jgi:hypothetical protein